MEMTVGVIARIISHAVGDDLPQPKEKEKVPTMLCVMN